MTDLPNAAPRRDWILTAVIGAVVVLFVYWGIYAIVAPVTVWDSQVYNLARLLIANQGGLFGNDGWNSERQLIFPWTFDAVHYFFLAAGSWGVALPSFACFAGIACVVFRIARASLGRRVAWWCVLTLFSLPTLMFQATSTKNDLAVVFGVACWYYAYWLWQSKPERHLYWWMALALGFTAGAKSSGIPLAILLAAFSAWKICRTRPAATEFAAALLLAATLFGSVETYLNNRLVHGHWLGPPNFVQDHQNRDGLRGATANFVRYVVANQNIGFDVRNRESPVPLALASGTRSILAFFGLRNVGYRSDFNDTNFFFLKSHLDSSSDFGPVGGLAILAAFFLAAFRPHRRAVRCLAALGLGSLALTAATIAWMPWNARFLMLSFTLCSLALTTQILDWSGARRLPAAAWLGVLLFSAFAFPWNSYNKKPSDLWNALAHRRRLEVKERPTMGPVIRAVEKVGKGAASRPTVLLCAGDDSWTLPLFQLRSVHCVPAPNLTDLSLREAARRPGGGYALWLNHAFNPELLPKLELVAVFEELDSSLYRIRMDPAEAVLNER